MAWYLPFIAGKTLVPKSKSFNNFAIITKNHVLRKGYYESFENFSKLSLALAIASGGPPKTSPI